MELVGAVTGTDAINVVVNDLGWRWVAFVMPAFFIGILLALLSFTKFVDDSLLGAITYLIVGVGIIIGAFSVTGDALNTANACTSTFSDQDADTDDATDPIANACCLWTQQPNVRALDCDDRDVMFTLPLDRDELAPILNEDDNGDDA